MRAHYQLLNQSRVHMTIDRHTIAPQKRAVLELDMNQDLVNHLAKQNIEVYKSIQGNWVGWLPGLVEDVTDVAPVVVAPVVEDENETIILPPKKVVVVDIIPEEIPVVVEDVVDTVPVEELMESGIDVQSIVEDIRSESIAEHVATEEKTTIEPVVEDVKPKFTESYLTELHHKKRQKLARELGVDDELPKTELIAAILAAQE